MPFDFAPCETLLAESRTQRGARAYQDGLAAEDIAKRHYLANGHRLLAERWRGPGGEVDLIFQGADEVVLVEVKKAANHDIAATRLSDRQLWRIARSAEAYISQNCADPFTPMRLDLAMTDQAGRLAVLENLALY